VQCLIAANTLKCAVLAHDTKQFDLRARIDLSDFVEENRAAVGLLEPTDAPFIRACERAFLMAEQLAFEKLGRKRRAMHRHKFRFVAAAQIMNGVCSQLLARPAFAFDEHIG